MKKIIFSFVIVLFLIAPVFTLADCSSQGVTVIYINGIFYNQNAAKQDLLNLKGLYEGLNVTNNSVKFLNGFNPSHGGGLFDLIDSVIQIYKGNLFVGYDLKTILQQIQPELTTRKILLVGHSQGTFYTNDAYNYLIKHGVPAQSIAVYNVATPADYVAGNGNYITSSNDKMITSIVATLAAAGFAKKPLPANITLPLSQADKDNPTGGHDFSKVYLQEAPDRIVSDMQGEINNLSAPVTSQPLQDGCFTAPTFSTLDDTQGLVLSAVDTSVVAFSTVKNSVQDVQTAIINTEKEVAVAGWQDLLYIASFVQDHPGLLIASVNNQTPQTSATITAQDNQIQNSSGTTAQVAQNNTSNTANPVIQNTNITAQESNQDQIDDILEKIDLLQGQIDQLNEAASANVSKVTLTDDKIDQQNQVDQQNDVNQQNQVSVTTTKTSNTGGSPIYPKILISEVQIGGLTDAQQEWVVPTIQQITSAYSSQLT